MIRKVARLVLEGIAALSAGAATLLCFLGIFSAIGLIDCAMPDFIGYRDAYSRAICTDLPSASAALMMFVVGVTLFGLGVALYVAGEFAGREPCS
jgi:hypothetical protein